MADDPKKQKPASFIITLDDYIAVQQKEPAVADRLGSDEAQKVIGKIAEEFGLNPAALAYAVEYAILKKDLAVYLPDLLRENLNVDLEAAVKIAKVVAEKIFPFFKNRLAEKENYQELWKDIPKAPLERDIPKGREVKGSAPVIAPTAKSEPNAPKSDFEKRAKDEMEVEINKKKKEIEAAPAPIKSSEDPLALKVKAIVSSSNITFTDTALQRRLETIISARLRDIRDETETKEMLVRGEKVGGLGLNAEQTERVLTLLGLAVREFTAEYNKIEEVKRKEFIKGQLEKEALRKMERERRERAEREKLYARVTGVTPTIKTIKKPTAVGQQQQVISSRPTATGQIPDSKFQIPTTKPRMEEIKFTPKIKGPVEELGTMVLEEFRRLSKDPKMAIEKIKDKLELLGEESFTKKTQGIAAWQESGVNKVYLNLLKESLNRGVAPIVVIEEYTQSAKPTLTKEEFTAIMELNRSLRF